MMNRQLRRAQQKQDERFDKERQKKKDKRQEKIASLKRRRLERREAMRARAEARRRGERVDDAATAKDAGAVAAKGGGPKRPAGRFSGVLMMATVFFIVLQSAVPPETAGELDVLRSLTSAGFYLLFAYFSTLWLMRRDTPRPVIMTLISGAFLTIGVEVAKRFQPEMATDWLMLALAGPFLLGGALLGRLVYVNSPS